MTDLRVTLFWTGFPGAFEAFASPSVITPFFLGTIAGATASGRVPPGITAGDISPAGGTPPRSSVVPWPPA